MKKRNVRVKARRLKKRLQDSKWLPKRYIDEETARTMKDARKHLTKDQAMMIAFMAIASVFLSAFAKLMVIMRFSTFPDNAIFYSWHPFTSVMIIASSLLYLYCIYAKGIDYWLAYFPAFMAIAYAGIEFTMIHSLLSPQQLADFFATFGIRDIPEWLTGPRV